MARVLSEYDARARLIQAGDVEFGYRRRLTLVLVRWPRAVVNAFSLCLKSLFSRPRPDVAIVPSHIEVVVLALLKWLLLRPRPVVVLQGFILTRRQSGILDRLRLAYFRFVIARTARVICHSMAEAKRYESLFPAAPGKFVFVPWGTHIHGVPDGVRDDDRPGNYALSAGRSGRDYDTLFRAFTGLEFPLHVVCDFEGPLASVSPPPHTTIERHCYGDCYRREVRAANFVVIPLAVADISAGQMVLIEAMAHSKPIIVTRTITMEEYARDGIEALLVTRGDPESLRSAAWKLIGEPALCATLARNARNAYVERHSMPAFVRNMLRAVADLDASAVGTG